MPEPADRRSGGQQRASNPVSGEIHVDQLVPQVAVGEERVGAMEVDHLAVNEPRALG
jgi:hypothetical protein